MEHETPKSMTIRTSGSHIEFKFFFDFSGKSWQRASPKGIASSGLCPTFQTLYLEAPRLSSLHILSNAGEKGPGLSPRGPRQCHASHSGSDDVFFSFVSSGICSISPLSINSIISANEIRCWIKLLYSLNLST